MTDLAAYPHTLEPLAPGDGGGFIARFPDIPGCIGVGDTPGEAIADGREALFACLDALKAADRVPPEPSAG
ncbi:type II toxin-antitoxin system HicB family antitoxin [Xanthobacter sp. V2C-8]|uniref:type II toxin-antitoxin system HicB family antitoxin n=1 Tax=Xanthobacter albus TaxID=3119929 RepID=UPI003727AD47